ncbi:hypothetical protein FACS189454_09310 [Planctomycetales bacterium]|nr:hypothetical protein FACS189454_09310 [Planctomycetales bacterium]
MITEYEPLTDDEWSLLEYVYQDVELPTVELTLQPPKQALRTFPKDLYNPDIQKFTTSPTLILAADDGKPSNSLKQMLQTDGSVKVKNETVNVETMLDDAWQFHIAIKSEVPVERIRLGAVPAFPNEKTDHWVFRLKLFTKEQRDKIFESALFVQFANGWRLKCVCPFA